MDYWADTGFAAGKIFGTLDVKEGKTMDLGVLKRLVNDQCFDYAIGWLLREEKIILVGDGKKTKITLK